MDAMNDRLDYFRQWLPDRPEIFHRLEEEASGERIPIVGPLVGQMLYLVARLRNARQILELGTATGYSTLYLARACRHTGGRILSLELDEAMARRARANVASQGMSDLVEVRRADALAALHSLEGPYDMIFIDIEKKDYAEALTACTRLMAPAGVLFADNTGFKDAHAFNQAIFQSRDWDSVNWWSFLPQHSPEHDGLCLAVRRQRRKARQRSGSF